MVEKVFISPNRVRAYGNIVNMKTGDDFTLVNSELTVTTDMVDGAEMTVFQFEVEGGISIALVSSSSTCNVGDNVLLTATVLDDNAPVEAAEVTFKVGETVLGTDETDANGVATYTYATSSAGSLSFSASYQTSTSNSVSVSVNHSYSLSFSQSTYTASGGSATLEMTLLEDNVAKSGASITVTGTDSSTYTATTNSSGVASFSVMGISASTVFTATYQGATATCTVTVQSYLFYDIPNSDRSSEYTNASIQTSSKTNYLPLTYNSNGYYIIKATSNEGNHYAKWITALDGLDNIRFSCEVSTNSFSGTNRFGIIIGDANDYKSERYQISNKTLEHLKQSGTETVIDSHTLSLTANAWYKMEYIVQGTSFTFTISDMNDTVLYTNTGTFNSSVITSSTTKQYGLYYLNYGSSYQKMFRNIKAESL